MSCVLWGSQSSRGVVYHIWKIHFKVLVTTPDQLRLGPDRPFDPSAGAETGNLLRSRRGFWRPRPRLDHGAFLRVFRQAMACRFEILLPVTATAEVAAAKAALDQAERLEQAWSIFRADSDLSRVNQ